MGKRIFLEGSRMEIDSKSFNASTLSRTLDVVSKYGPDDFFLDTAFKIAMDMKLLSREPYLDSTSNSFQGRHKKGRRGKNFTIKKDGEIDLTYGHSKAKRPNLIQMVMSMITGGSSGIPYWINTHSGNAQDKDLFQDVIARMTSWLDTYAPMKTNYFVADSALYSKSYLLNHSHHTLWISRVPESVKKAKALLERGHKGNGWKKLKGGLKYRAFKTEFCGIPQRWFVVHSHRAYYKEKINFGNRLDEKEYELHRTVNKLKRQLFKEKDIALETAKKIRGSYPFHKVKTRVVPHYEGYIGSDQRYMALQGYAVEVEYE